MSAKHFSYSSTAREEYSLENAENMFIIRFKNQVEPFVLFSIYPILEKYKNRIYVKESFKESCAFIFKIEGSNPALLRDEIKAIINQNKHSNVEYIGSVKVFTGTNIYQIYTGNIFLKFRNGVNQKFINKIFEKHSLKIKLTLKFSENTFFCKVPDEVGSNIFDVSLEILKYQEVEYCHPEMVVKSRSISEGTEYRNFDGEKNLWVFEKTKIVEAWKYTKGKGVKICVIDDGIDFTHPAFQNPDKIVNPKDMHDKLGNRRPQHLFDDRHGTAVSSIVVSSDDKAMGIAPEAQLIPIRATSLGSVLQSDAFYWAVNSQADVIVCSWGPPDGDFRNPNDNLREYPIPPHTDLAIRYAAQKGRSGKGSIIVFAAGNGNEPMKFDKYASHEEVIGVGAINFNDTPTVYSDYGHPMFCCFPSGDYETVNGVLQKTKKAITVADAVDTKGYSDTNYYQYFDGTSASCPGVAGVIALMLSANPQLTKKQVKEIIKNTCKKIGKPSDYNDFEGKSSQFGYGLVQADQAVLKSVELLNKKNMKAYSLHIGINNVDKSYYGNNVSPLSGCIFDMNQMQDLASSIGYKTHTLRDEQATQQDILSKITEFGNLAGSEGILMITYAGHGAPLREEEGLTNDNESTGKDQAWVTYDSFLVDDKIHQTLAQLPEGLRVVFVSDSCFSGSITREVFDPSSEFTQKRFVSYEDMRAVLSRNNQSVEEFLKKTPAEPKASIILLAACTDNQPAYESKSQGLFTVRLLETYQELRKARNKNVNYRQFINLISNKIGSRQQPQYFLDGKENKDFENQFPFSIDGNITVVPPITPNKNTQKSTNPNQYKSLIIHNADGSTQDINPQFASNNGVSAQRSIQGETEWDKAYELALENNLFVEPDAASNLFQPFDEGMTRGSNEDESKAEYLDTYPNPKDGGSKVRFIWHLDKDHSQLDIARQQVYPEINLGIKPNPDNQVVIGHIDTGYFDSNPHLPVNLQKGLSTHFRNGQSFEGAEDVDADFIMDIGEAQGHGNATLMLLAGGKVDVPNEYTGYFGAVPFAKVISMKISETVALLSGRNFASAIDFAIANRCEVITMSMAGLPTKIMADAVNRAYEAGIVIVSAASNNFSKGAGNFLMPKVTLYPARFDRVIGAVGAAYNQAPYLVELQEQLMRAAGGRFMQTCYGPEEALPTSLAAYTPNITWFNGDINVGDPQFIFRGGGTSSATPQIAAAAALYIQKYRDRLNTIAGTDKWKKAEIVRQVLFLSANKTTPYNFVYGNGIVRAAEALKPDYEPEKIVLIIQKAKKAEVSGGFFKRLFRLFESSSNSSTTASVVDMLGLELFQLLHRDPNLNKYLETMPTSGDIMEYPNLPQLIEDVKNSRFASNFIKQNIINLSLGITRSGGVRGSVNSAFNNFKVDSPKGSYILASEGISCNILNSSFDNLASADTWVDELTIEIGSLPARGSAEESLMIINKDEKFQSAVLIEGEIDGKKYFEWAFEGNENENASQAREVKRHLQNKRAIQIRLNLSGSAQERGIFDKGKKLILKIFKWLKPKIADKVTKPLLNEFLASLGDSKYELLEFDFAINVWKEFDGKVSKDSILVMPGLFSTIEKGFTEFFSNPIVKNAVGNRKVLGFNMPTLVQGIKQNAEELKKRLDAHNLENNISTIITRSRGGIVARYLLENLKFKGITKLVMAAPPNEGIQMASSANWMKLINTATNVANLAFGTYVPILPKITAIFKAVANQVVDLPGINDLEIGSSIITGLNSANPNISSYFVVVSNFTPDLWLKKVFDSLAVDKLIFKSDPNDTVVPTAGAVFLKGTSSIQLPTTNYFVLGGDESVNHFSYLRTENVEIINWVISKI